MSKENKFRAWDKEEERMIVHEQEFIPLKVTNFGVFRLDACIKENRWILADVKRFEIMQYTGLKDKNENEIYEGDIIEEVYPGSKIIKGKIIYNEDAFEIEWISKDHFNNNVLHVRNKDIQVIGNIFDNQELLKEVK